jgi:hypothetical protein
MRQSTLPDPISTRLRRLERENQTLGARVVELQRQIERMETSARPLNVRLARATA